MTQIHVITRDNRPFYADHLQTYFRLRHEIFVGERGWEDLRRPDGRDVDAYDNDIPSTCSPSTGTGSWAARGSTRRCSRT
jgi:N-acyl-L-homoserine lactone synthetase